MPQLSDISRPAGATRILALDLPATPVFNLPAGLVVHAGFADLDAALLERVKPDHVLLPLLTPGHDATAVIDRLQAIGYGGLITVVAMRLPDARMVESELRSLGPGARLTLLTPSA